MEALLSTIGLDLEIGALSPGGGAPEVQEKRSLFFIERMPRDFHYSKPSSHLLNPRWSFVRSGPCIVLKRTPACTRGGWIEEQVR